jgi:hypothetical protein
MKKKKITISWAFGTDKIMNIDFGLFKAHKKNKIKIDEKMWEDYLKRRYEFETAQATLCNLIEN